MDSYLEAELVRVPGLGLQVRLRNTHDSKRIVRVESLPWFYRWKNGTISEFKMLKFAELRTPLNSRDARTLEHQSFVVEPHRGEWVANDAANDCLIQTSRAVSGRFDAENFVFVYVIEGEEARTLDLSAGIPYPKLEDR